MAIVVEQEKKRINWFALAVVGSVVGIAVIALYFLFFSSVPLIERVAPAGEGFETIRTVSRITFEPDRVFGSPAFRVLRPYGTSSEPALPEARSNPFQ